MALIGILRNKMGKIVVGAIMLTMVAFIGTDLIGNSALIGGQDQDIAEIGGETISNTKFQSKVDDLTGLFGLASRRNPLQEETDQIRNQAWNSLLIENIYSEQFDDLGIVVTQQEEKELISGDNIHPFLVQNFTSGQADPSEEINQYLIYLRNQAQDVEKLIWIESEKMVYRDRLFQKYNNLFSKTNYVTKYEARDEYISQNGTASIDYLYVPFLSVSDSSVSVTDSELNAYLDENETEYNREETRSLEYVAFEIKPSSADSAIVIDEVAELRSSLEEATNDSSFVVINSDDAYPFITYNDDNLPAAVQGQNVGFVSEPTIVNGAYEFYKLSRKDEITADSALYRVAKMKKEFFVSDETINETYRKADLFAASAGNLEEFRRLADEQGLTKRTANRIGKNAQRVGPLNEARGLVLWLYNDGEVGAVSDVKEVNDQYVVMAMTAEQEEGTANLDEVRNQVERKVRNQKKADFIMDKLNGLDASDLESMATSYGEGAKTGSADYQLFSNSISGVGYGPEAIGISFALDEEETTRAFAVQDGVILVKLTAKDYPADVDDYSSFALQVSSQRLGPNAMVADFPLSYFRIFVSRKVDNAVKEFAEIEDLRYKFF